MKLIIYFLILALTFLLMAQTSISLHPFRITIEKPYFAVGMILIIIGVFFIEYQGEINTFKKVFEMIEQIKS